MSKDRVPPARIRRALRVREAGGANYFLVILLGGACGVGWALYDYHQAGGDLGKLGDQVSNSFGGSPQGKQSPAPPPPTPGPTQTVSAVPAPQTPRPIPPPVPAQPLTPAVSVYPGPDIAVALRLAEGDLKAGRFAEARDRFLKYELERVAGDQRGDFRKLRERADLLTALARETNLIPAQSPPKLVNLVFKTGKPPFQGTIISKDDKKIEFRMLNQITATFDAWEVLQIEDMDALRAKRVVEGEFDRRWKAIRPGRPMDAFRLGEFCMVNGLPERLADCFERAVQMVPNAETLIGTVRDEKANALYDTFFFFLTMGDIAHAENALGLLKTRYPSSPLIAQADQERSDVIRLALGTQRHAPPPKAARPAVARPAPGPTPSVPPAAAQPPPSPPGALPASTGSPSAPKFESDPFAPSATPSVSAAPAGLTSEQFNEYRGLVEQANAAFDDGMKHLDRSNPSQYPDTWPKDNSQALDLFAKALELYGKALDIYNDPNLWEREREANLKRVLCNKRKHMR